MDSSTEYRSVTLEWLVKLLFFASGISSLLIALQFNLKTYRLVKEIQRLERINGRDWPFWSDARKKYIFMFQPELLIDESNEGDVLSAKKALLLHRKTFPRRLLLGVGILVLGFVVPIMVLVLIGLYQHYF